MDKHSQPITFKKENEPISFLITVFSTLSKEGDDKELVVDGNKVYMRKRQVDEITKLHVDYSKVKHKILDWFDDRKSMFLELNDEESKILRQCIHAAYYFITEKQENQQSYSGFIKYYNHFFKP